MSNWEIHVQLLLAKGEARDADTLCTALVDVYTRSGDQGGDTDPEFVAEAHLSGGPDTTAAASIGGTLQIRATTPGHAVDQAMTLLRGYLRTARITDRGVSEISISPGGIDPRTLP
ncbi:MULTISPECIES: hypothetical protein [unclassified Streptomyces]|uniref:hypothetical protein n=1 Tax=unclassified Streptomyces TaxID=2593676 RepID=UPI000DABD77C|nr:MULTISPECIES: hypothetical protein [unclassified Streptomyces]